MSIQVKNQHAGIINNVDGQQVVYGGQHGAVVTGEQARRAVRELRDALGGVDLDETTAAEVRAHVAQIDAAVHAPEPDKRRAGGTLNRLIRLLADAGALATASATLIGPLQTLAGWIGVHAVAVLSLLA
jgi:hypothetical protein